ncbi:NAD-dependent DNA ligase LigA [Eubacterium oxidoreducens]|uniref:DNA ligase n=1 Tax=Eubacterium oxidoreducens TaxID=1732 RepID=A0A1G6AJN3_EUBOX|nr:NAD-dependent DNA ligase LigA [Eubacterium oxidoreducens]SDB08624.1 DNA ligase (NAD+) [Eubacterium oxidoreducens]
MDDKKRIEELVTLLNEASDRYYGGLEEIMSNYEWDAAFDELVKLEQQTGYRLDNSPTQTTGAVVKNGAREEHEYPALSLAKTKEVTKLQEWAGQRPVNLSWKLDGLTLVLTYDNGSLTKILTRGSGVAGNNITYMKDAIEAVPSKIEYRGHLVVRGEAVISYTDFDMINASLDNEDDYANPRNLAAGTLALDATNLETVKKRKVHLYAFTLVHIDDEIVHWSKRMEFLKNQGFDIVDYEKTNAQQLPQVVERWTKLVENGKMDIPVDGLVICYEDTNYSSGGSVTGHHATRGGLAFKWQDVSALSRLDHVEWSCAASTITPVAVFEPIWLEGTMVSRASLCNISEMERLGIGENHETILEIIKANKIIPKCISVKEAKGVFAIPAQCPVCNAATQVKISQHSGTKTLHCTNEECAAKHVMKFARFVSKTGMDIDGMSVQTILKFMNLGYIYNFADFYHLHQYEDEIRNLDGFGDKSCENLLLAIENSRSCSPVSFVYALCIPQIGVDAAKKIMEAIGWKEFVKRLEEVRGFDDIATIGTEKSTSIIKWYQNDKNRKVFYELLDLLNIESMEAVDKTDGSLKGMKFVVTGDLVRFKNRSELASFIESENGSVASSVSKKTNYLINNDVTSTSGKNQKALSLGIEIISENDFISRFGGENVFAKGYVEKE